MEAKKEQLKGQSPSSTDGGLRPLNSQEEAAAAVKDYAHGLVTLAVLTTARDQALNQVQTKHDEGIHGQEGIRAVSARLTALKKQLEDWAVANRKVFGDVQSLEFSHGFLKFRQGSRKIDFRFGWNEDKVLAKLKSYPVTSQWREYLRITADIDRQELLRQTKEGGKLPEPRLKEIGLKVTRDENFNIEAKPDAVANDCDLRV